MQENVGYIFAFLEIISYLCSTILQLPRSVIDWGTIKNILQSYENNARNIYNALLVSSFIRKQHLLAFISLWLWCSFQYLPTFAFCSRGFGHAFHFGLQFGITPFPNKTTQCSFHFQIAVFFEMFFYKTMVGAVAGIMDLRIDGITELV